MAKSNVGFLAFNGGMVSPLALARTDLTRLKFAAQVQTNFMPRTTGPMMLRPGLQWIGNLPDNAYVEPFPFVYAEDDYAIIEMGDGMMRVRLWNPAYDYYDFPLTRDNVATVISDPSFNGGGTWQLTNSGGATSSLSNGQLILQPIAIGSLAQCDQLVGVAGGDYNVVHALRIQVTQGIVSLTIGTTRFGQEIIATQHLGVGWHSIAFRPGTSPCYVTLFSRLHRATVVEQCAIEPFGTWSLPIPWSDPSTLRMDQSAGVVYIAARNFQQYKIERRGPVSWSLVLFQPDDGPFEVRAPQDITMECSVNIGNGLITASSQYFTPSMVGCLFRLFFNSTSMFESVGANGQFTDAVRTTGVGSSRKFGVAISGTWSGTLVEQRSYDSATTGFANTGSSWTGNATFTGGDTQDNSIVWYRYGFDTAYGSGSATVNIEYAGAAAAGVIRTTSYVSPTQMWMEVLPHGDFQGLVSVGGTNDWQEGEWSNHNGWPSCVKFYQGRLWWFGNGRIWGSVSDAYESYDIDAVGDSAPLDRTIGAGAVDTIMWALPLQRLILGLQLSEASIRSTAFDQPITPTDFSLRDASTQGSADVDAVRVDTRGIYIQRSHRRVFQLAFNLDDQDYNSNDLTALLPDLDKNFIRIMTQRVPDTRIHCLREDGTVLVLLYDVPEKVICWYKVVTDGVIERFVTLPGNEEDMVYYYVARSSNGQTVRTIEKFAKMSECSGGLINKQLDGAFIYTGPPAYAWFGMPWLEGRMCAVWGDGKYVGQYPVTGGELVIGTGAQTWQNVVIGLPYVAQFQSAKLAWAAQFGTALGQKKRINKLGLVLGATHASGIQFGQNFTLMDTLPQVFQGVTQDPNTVYQAMDEPMFVLPGNWDTDARLCLQATAPLPATVIGAIIEMETSESLSGQ